MFADLIRGAREAGHEVIDEDLSLFIGMHQQRLAAAGGKADRAVFSLRASYASHIAHLIRAQRCDMAMCLWLDPLLALPMVSDQNRPERRVSYLAAAGVTTLHWWLDAPFWAYEGRALPALDRSLFADSEEASPARHLHCVNNSGTADEMRRICNFRHAFASPYGVDAATFHRWEGVSVEFDLAINCGPGDPAPTPLMLAELAKDEPDVRAIRQEQAWAASAAAIATLREAGASDGADALVEAWITEQLEAPDRPMLEKFDAAVSKSDAPAALVAALTNAPTSPALWARVTAAIRAVDAWQRAFTSAYLSRRFNCLLVGAGADAWKRSGWPVDGPSVGNVGYHELALCYSRCHAGLNVMRYQDDVGMNPKVLEIAASGCVPLVRDRAGLSGMFDDGAEMLAFNSPARAAERLRSILNDGDARQSISTAARARIERDHTWRTRAVDMLREAQARTGA
jgi:glycosyltransferase involved in cell wall biosynthesis